jgi:hypothetical protein
MVSKPMKLVAVAAAAAALAVLAGVYLVPALREHSRNVALGERWVNELRRHPGFSGREPADAPAVSFAYAPPTEENLRRLRETYPLEAIAGTGSETDRLIRLLTWVFELTGHANEPRIPEELNALSLIPLAKDRHMQMNCYMKSVILNEVYLAMGWPSRQTHLLPFEKEEEASHFVTSVYASSLGRWVLMDPDCGAYVTDERGNLLGVREVRQRLVTGEPLIARGLGGGSRLAEAWDEARNRMRGVSYRWFLSAFAFKIRCPQQSRFDQAADPARVFFELIPDGYRKELVGTSGTTASGKRILYVNDEEAFWRRP